LSRLASLKAVSTRGELADLLEYPKSALSFAVFIIPPKDRYISFEIAKKGTGTRTIFAPIPELKGLQTRLSNLLYDCQREINPPLEYPLRSYSHGFQKKRKLSIFSNAEKHRNRKHVFNTDLKNFFPSINFGRVQGYFLKNRSFELRHDIATLIAHIACHEGSLPQGAPTSPVISDLISSILDQRLGKLARKHRCT
jgi:RNA-directed DNA polymerase